MSGSSKTEHKLPLQVLEELALDQKPTIVMSEGHDPRIISGAVAAYNAGIAEACNLKGVVARTMEDLTAALNQAVKDQMENGVTTLIEAMINQELGEPFRRDAMTAPVAVAGINAKDMRPQQV